MKRLFIIFLILLWTGAAWGRAVNVVVGQAGAAVSCSTEAYNDTTGTTLGKIGEGAVYRFAGEFTNTANDCVCKAIVSLKKNNSPNGNVSVKLYSKHGSTLQPDTLLGTATETLTQGDLTTSYAEYTFNFSPCVTLTSTNNYLSIESDTLNSSTTYFATQYNSAGTLRVAEYASSWIGVDADSIFYVIIYK